MVKIMIVEDAMKIGRTYYQHMCEIWLSRIIVSDFQQWYRHFF